MLIATPGAVICEMRSSLDDRLRRFFRQHFGTDVGVQSVEVPFITSFCPDVGVQSVEHLLMPLVDLFWSAPTNGVLKVAL